jgi:hypothetical protein
MYIVQGLISSLQWSCEFFLASCLFALGLLWKFGLLQQLSHSWVLLHRLNFSTLNLILAELCHVMDWVSQRLFVCLFFFNFRHIEWKMLAEAWYMALFWTVTDQVLVLLQLTYFQLGYFAGRGLCIACKTVLCLTALQYILQWIHITFWLDLVPIPMWSEV